MKDNETHYVIYIDLKGKKHQAFNGTFEQALEDCFISPEEREEISRFEDLLMLHCFGDNYRYEEVDEEEYNEAL